MAAKSSSSASFSIAGALEKMGKADKDFRFMATTDLHAQLQREGDLTTDREMERKLVAAIVKQVEDNNTEVQNLTVGILGLLVLKVQNESVDSIVRALAENVLGASSKEELRDLSALGLTNIVAAVSGSSNTAAIITEALFPRMVRGLQGTNADIQVRCLQITCAGLARFGPNAHLAAVLPALIPCLSSPRSTVRKEAVAVAGVFSAVAEPALFNELCTFLVDHLAAPKASDNVRILVQTVGTLSRSVGNRLGHYVDRFVPLILSACGRPEEVEVDNDDNTKLEVMEICLQTFHSFIMRCPKEVSPHLDTIVDRALGFLFFDPNYVADDDEEEEQPAEDDDDDDDDGVSDDEDISWKVRKAAAKCLSAVITTRPDLLDLMYQQVAPKLISRFSEREESVKAEIFATFVELLRQTSRVNRAGGTGAVANLPEVLVSQLANIVGGTARQLKHKSPKTRNVAFTLLQELVDFVGGLLSPFFAEIIGGVVYSLTHRTSDNNLRLKVLKFFRVLLSVHEPRATHPFVPKIVGPVVKLVNDDYFKTAAEGLRVAGELVRIMAADGFDYSSYVPSIYTAVAAKLRAQESDQEVKQCALRTISFIVALTGDRIAAADLAAALHLVLDKLRNEITWLSAVRALGEIAQSPLNINMSDVLVEAVTECAQFLRKSHRALKQHTLQALTAMVARFGGTMADNLYAAFLIEAAPLVSDQDLLLAHLAMGLATASLVAKPSAAADLVLRHVLPATVALAQSSLLQGAALDGMIALFGALLAANVASLSYESLVGALTAAIVSGNQALPKQAYSSIAQVVASMTVAAPESARSATLTNLLADIATEATPEPMRLLSLVTLGEIGHRMDLGFLPNLEEVILNAFDIGSEEAKSAASFTLGNVAAGSLVKFVPFMVSQISSHQRRQYLLLHGLKETISRVSGREGARELILPHVTTIWELLLAHAENEEEGTRNVVAECLGKLALINPSALIPALVEKAGSPSPFTRGTIVAAVKFTITAKPNPEVDELLPKHICTFLLLLGDSDYLVRLGALRTLNYAAHNKPSLIRDLLSQLWQLIYGETVYKTELTKQIKIGPFTRTVDAGIENRKAAFELLLTLLGSALDRIDVYVFTTTVVNGLADKEIDIQSLNLLIIQRLTAVAGASLMEALASMIANLNAIVTKKLKDNAAETDRTQNDELIRVALRTVFLLNQVPGASSVLQWEEFMRTVVTTGELAPKFAAVSQEMSGSNRDDNSMDTQ